MNKPTLEEQIRLSKMSREELVDLLMPHGLVEHMDFWLHNHCILLWRLLKWNWFNTLTGERGFIKFAKHGFGEWDIPTNVESRADTRAHRPRTWKVE